MTDRRIMLLELTDRDGASSWAECVAFNLPNYTAETVETAWLAIGAWLAPRLLGRTLDGPEVVHDLLAVNIRGHNMAKAALEMACWGLAAESAGVSLSSLLGGTRDRVPTGISLGIQREPAALVARAQAAVAEGYRKIKVKIRPGQDVAYVRAVRAALGDGIGIMAERAGRVADHADLRSRRRRRGERGARLRHELPARAPLGRARRRQLRVRRCGRVSRTHPSGTESSVTAPLA
jgi:O-succinylbenzoate synthase